MKNDVAHSFVPYHLLLSWGDKMIAFTSVCVISSPLVISFKMDGWCYSNLKVLQ